jgi:hypothetical protein
LREKKTKTKVTCTQHGCVKTLWDKSYRLIRENKYEVKGKKNASKSASSTVLNFFSVFLQNRPAKIYNMQSKKKVKPVKPTGIEYRMGDQICKSGGEGRNSATGRVENKLVWFEK